MDKDLRTISKTNYTCEEKSFDVINAGSLQRIADAAEVMASNYLKLQNELDLYKKRYMKEVDYSREKTKKISTLKGQVTRLKNQLLVLKNVKPCQ